MPKSLNLRIPHDLRLGLDLIHHLPKDDQLRQRREIEEILRRFRNQPGLILADEVGMGKTFVALGVAVSFVASPLGRKGPVIIMIPPALFDKWETDLTAFTRLYLTRWHCRPHDPTEPAGQRTLTYANHVKHSVNLLKILDDTPSRRPHIIFLSHRAMSCSQTDMWIRFYLIRSALKIHGRGGAYRLHALKGSLHRWMGLLLSGSGGLTAQNAHAFREDLWPELFDTDPDHWRSLYNRHLKPSAPPLENDPVPAAVRKAVEGRRVDLSPLAVALEDLPLRQRGGRRRYETKVLTIKTILKQEEQSVWASLIQEGPWQSPLLILDEAHHLRNPKTTFARQMREPETPSPEEETPESIGDGALVSHFDRMLFLTATPFQLSHHELMNVLRGFGATRITRSERQDLEQKVLEPLSQALDDNQRKTLRFLDRWKRLRPQDLHGMTADEWWSSQAPPPSLKALYQEVLTSKETAEKLLKPWIIRHNKTEFWPSGIHRRLRRPGRSLLMPDETTDATEEGLPIPSADLLPFYIATRSACEHHSELLTEALCSSYEAFRQTRNAPKETKDLTDDPSTGNEHPTTISKFYLAWLDRLLDPATGRSHPKLEAVVRKTADLWEQGEKVVIFAFYLKTCQTLRLRISAELERRILDTVRRRAGLPPSASAETITMRIRHVQQHLFRSGSPFQRALLTTLQSLVNMSDLTKQEREHLPKIILRFLKTPAALAYHFPWETPPDLPAEAAKKMLSSPDPSGLTWQNKIRAFLNLLRQSKDRKNYLDNLQRIETGMISSVQDPELADAPKKSAVPYIQTVTGRKDPEIRNRIIRAFNTPFLPDILISSCVLAEGVDLHRFCRHIIHYDLSWNPSVIEQRTGRIDRIGSKAENRSPIVVYMPYLAGCADERQYKVMRDRETWFRIIMGQDSITKNIPNDIEDLVPLPQTVVETLRFNLGLTETTTPHPRRTPKKT